MAASACDVPGVTSSAQRQYASEENPDIHAKSWQPPIAGTQGTKIALIWTILISFWFCLNSFIWPDKK